MAATVLYQVATGWITIQFSDYHSWQGHIADVPDAYLGYIFIGVQNGQETSSLD